MDRPAVAGRAFENEAAGECASGDADAGTWFCPGVTAARHQYLVRDVLRKRHRYRAGSFLARHWLSEMIAQPLDGLVNELGHGAARVGRGTAMLPEEGEQFVITALGLQPLGLRDPGIVRRFLVLLELRIVPAPSLGLILVGSQLCGAHAVGQWNGAASLGVRQLCGGGILPVAGGAVREQPRYIRRPDFFFELRAAAFENEDAARGLAPQGVVVQRLDRPRRAGWGL